MSWHRGTYPENWDVIAERIKQQAGRRCEKCGSPSEPGRILTVHHLDGDKSNVSDDNLVALCQVCHLHVQARFIPGQIPMWPEEWQLSRGLEKGLRDERLPTQD